MAIWPYMAVSIAMYDNIHPNMCMFDVGTCVLGANILDLFQNLQICTRTNSMCCFRVYCRVIKQNLGSTRF